MFDLKTPEEMKELRQDNPWLRFFDLSDENFYQVIVCSTRAAIGSDSLDVFYEKIHKLVGDDHVKAVKLIKAIIDNRFLEYRDELSGFSEFAKKIGWQEPVTEETKDALHESVENFLKEQRISELDHVLQSRLVFILVAYFKGERTLEEVEAVLTRPIKVGGLEMEAEKAAEIVQAVEEKKTREDSEQAKEAEVETIPEPEEDPDEVADNISPQENPFPEIPPARVVSDIRPPSPPAVIEDKVEDKKPEPLAPPAPVAEVKPEPAPIRPLISDIKPITPPPTQKPLPPLKPLQPLKPLPPLQPLHHPEDKIEIAKAAEAIQEKVGLAKAKTPLDEAVNSLVSSCNLKFGNEDLQKRFSHAVDSRLRDVRDAFETRDLLERAVELGGLGWGGVGLVKVMEELEKIVIAQKAQWSSEVAKEKQALKKVKEQEIKKQQDAELARKKAAKPKVRLEPITPVMSAGSVQQSGRQVVADVAFTRKLSGPVEELQNMSLSEFRRLSRYPEEAATKVLDKINLLEEQGIAKRVAAIKAWRMSPVNRLYLEINKQALMSGKKMTDVIATRTDSGLETLSLEEIKVINTLNGGLRF